MRVYLATEFDFREKNRACFGLIARVDRSLTLASVLSWCTGSQGNNHCSFFV